MEILTPQAVKTEKQQVKAEAQARVRDLGNEEARLIASVNSLRDQEQDELRKKEERESVDDSALGVRKSVLAQEVEALEARKAQALLPVDTRHAELTARENDVEKEGIALRQMEEELFRGRDTVRRREVAASEHENRNTARTMELDERDRKSAAAEAQIENSTRELARKSTEHSLQVQKDNEAMEKREQQVLADTMANEIRAAELDAIAEKQAEERRGIADAYATLESARKETLEGKLT